MSIDVGGNLSFLYLVSHETEFSTAGCIPKPNPWQNEAARQEKRERLGEISGVQMEVTAAVTRSKSTTAARIKAVRETADQNLLIEALADPSALVVEAAAKRMEAPKAAGALLRTYLRIDGPDRDPGCWGRMAILEALARLGAPEGEEAAVKGIRTVQVEPVAGGMADTATGLRAASAGVLANLGAPGALLDLAWLLHDFEPNAGCSRQERPFAKLATRVAAARAIGALGEPAGAAILAVKLAFPGEELPDCLVECMDALAALKEPRALELLAPWLDHPSPFCAAGAGTAMAAAGGESALPLLLGALERTGPDVRTALVYAIGSIRAESAREALRALARHPDKLIAGAAQELT